MEPAVDGGGHVDPRRLMRRILVIVVVVAVVGPTIIWLAGGGSRDDFRSVSNVMGVEVPPPIPAEMGPFRVTSLLVSDGQVRCSSGISWPKLTSKLELLSKS